MNRWFLPITLGLIALIVGYQAVVVSTPFMLMNAAMKKIGGRTPVNQFAFAPPPSAANQPIVRPSPDLVYASCTFNVSKGPVFVRAEPVPGHYWSLSVFDGRTDVAAVMSDRDTHGGPAQLVIHRRGTTAPAGWRSVPVDYPRGIALIRVLMSSPDDFANVDAIRRRSTCSATPPAISASAHP